VQASLAHRARRADDFRGSLAFGRECNEKGTRLRLRPRAVDNRADCSADGCHVQGFTGNERLQQW
jgi:hypothetical protein